MVDEATGSVVASYSYDSFGSRSETGSLSQRYGFTGREVDAESGLIYFRARAYDPALGQFLQRDPIGFAAGDMNLYAYAWNDPYNWSDPSGLAVGDAANTAITAAGAASAGYIIGQGTLALGAAIGLQLAGLNPFDLWLNQSNSNGNGGSNGGGNTGAGSQNGSGSNAGASSGANDNTGVESLPPGGPDGDHFGSGQDAKDSRRVSSNRRADKIARELGYEDAHDLKAGYGSEYDIFVNNKTGNVYLGPRSGTGDMTWVGNLNL